MGHGDDAHRHARGAGHAAQGADAGGQGIEQFLGGAAENGVIENAGQLSGDGDQKIHLIRLELAHGGILD